ncbi:MAG: transposase, partial [Thermotogota bacterium]|nr:transposase [Thermotogota bacterium]
CQEDIYFKELLRYIHLNPLRAKIVSDIKELNKYPYSGHSVLTGNKKRKWCDTPYVLSYFGKKVTDARKRYLDNHLKGTSQSQKRMRFVIGG